MQEKPGHSVTTLSNLLNFSYNIQLSIIGRGRAKYRDLSVASVISFNLFLNLSIYFFVGGECNIFQSIYYFQCINY